MHCKLYKLKKLVVIVDFFTLTKLEQQTNDIYIVQLPLEFKY